MAVDEDVRAIEAEPGLLGNVALGDGEEEGDASLGGEEVVAGVVELAGEGVVADREELAGLDKEEGEVHGVGVELCTLKDADDVGGELVEPVRGEEKVVA